MLLSRGELFRDTVEANGFTLTVHDDGILELSLNGALMWQSDVEGDPTVDHYAILQGDCNFIVFSGTPEARGPFHWKTDTSFEDMDACFLAVFTDEKKIRLSAGTPDKIGATLWEDDFVGES